MVARGYEEAATPVTAAGYGLHALAADFCPGCRIAVPFPVPRGADGLHDALAQHIGKRAAEALEEGEGENVHAHVVVFVVGAGRPPLAELALLLVVFCAADLAEVVDLIGFFPQHAIPFGRLREEVAPRDLAVVRAVEVAGLHGRADAIIDAADETVADRDAREQREIALGDAEGDIGASRVAPLADNAAALHDHAGRSAARTHDARDLAPRPRLVPLHVSDVAAIRIVERARPGAFGCFGPGDGRFELFRIQAGGGGREGFPGCILGRGRVRRLGHESTPVDGGPSMVRIRSRGSAMRAAKTSDRADVGVCRRPSS